MAFICGSWEAFPFKYMIQMTTTSCTSNFNPHSIRVRLIIEETLLKTTMASTKFKIDKRKGKKKQRDRKEAYGSIYGSRKTLKESWPATARIEFGCGLVKRSPTACTVIDSLLIELVIFTYTGVSGQDIKHFQYSIVNLMYRLQQATLQAKYHPLATKF